MSLLSPTDCGVQHLWRHRGARRASGGDQPGQDRLGGREPPHHWGLGTLCGPKTFPRLRLQEDKGSQQGTVLLFKPRAVRLRLLLLAEGTGRHKGCFTQPASFLMIDDLWKAGGTMEYSCSLPWLSCLFPLNAAGRAEGCTQGAVWRSGLRGVSHPENHDPCLLCQDLTCQAAQPACPQPASVWIQPIRSVQTLVIVSLLQLYYTHIKGMVTFWADCTFFSFSL